MNIDPKLEFIGLYVLCMALLFGFKRSGAFGENAEKMKDSHWIGFTGCFLMVVFLAHYIQEAKSGYKDSHARDLEAHLEESIPEDDDEISSVDAKFEVISGEMLNGTITTWYHNGDETEIHCIIIRNGRKTPHMQCSRMDPESVV